MCLLYWNPAIVLGNFNILLWSVQHPYITDRGSLLWWPLPPFFPSTHFWSYIILFAIQCFDPWSSTPVTSPTCPTSFLSTNPVFHLIIPFQLWLLSWFPICSVPSQFHFPSRTGPEPMFPRPYLLPSYQHPTSLLLSPLWPSTNF